MWYHKLALIVASIGAINWGLDQLGFNLVEKLLSFAGQTGIMVIYYLIAVIGLYALYLSVSGNTY